MADTLITATHSLTGQKASVLWKHKKPPTPEEADELVYQYYEGKKNNPPPQETESFGKKIKDTARDAALSVLTPSYSSTLGKAAKFAGLAPDVEPPESIESHVANIPQDIVGAFTPEESRARFPTVKRLTNLVNDVGSPLLGTVGAASSIGAGSIAKMGLKNLPAYLAKSGLVIGSGVAAQKGVQAGGEALNLPPEVTELSSQAAGLGAGIGAVKGISKFGRTIPKVPVAENTEITSKVISQPQLTSGEIPPTVAPEYVGPYIGRQLNPGRIEVAEQENLARQQELQNKQVGPIVNAPNLGNIPMGEEMPASSLPYRAGQIPEVLPPEQPVNLPFRQSTESPTIINPQALEPTPVEQANEQGIITPEKSPIYPEVKSPIIDPNYIGSRAREYPEVTNPTQQEMVTLYRAEPLTSSGKGIPDWIKNDPEFQNYLTNIDGRWFTDDLQNLEWYKENVGPDIQIKQVQVPREIWEASKSNQETQRYSRRPESEGFLPQDIARQATIPEVTNPSLSQQEIIPEQTQQIQSQKLEHYIPEVNIDEIWSPKQNKRPAPTNEYEENADMISDWIDEHNRRDSSDKVIDILPEREQLQLENPWIKDQENSTLRTLGQTATGKLKEEIIGELAFRGTGLEAPITQEVQTQEISPKQEVQPQGELSQEIQEEPKEYPKETIQSARQEVRRSLLNKLTPEVILEDLKTNGLDESTAKKVLRREIIKYKAEKGAIGNLDPELRKWVEQYDATVKKDEPITAKGASSFLGQTKKTFKELRESQVPAAKEVADHIIRAEDEGTDWLNHFYEDMSQSVIKSLSSSELKDLNNILRGIEGDYSKKVYQAADNFHEIMEEALDKTREIEKREGRGVTPWGAPMGEIKDYYSWIEKQLSFDPDMLNSWNETKDYFTGERSKIGRFIKGFKKEDIPLGQEIEERDSVYNKGLGMPESRFTKPRSKEFEGELEDDPRKVILAYGQGMKRAMFDKFGVIKAREAIGKIPDSVLKERAEDFVRNFTGFDVAPLERAGGLGVTGPIMRAANNMFIKGNINVPLLHLSKLPNLWYKMPTSAFNAGLREVLSHPIQSFKEAQIKGLGPGNYVPRELRAAYKATGKLGAWIDDFGYFFSATDTGLDAIGYKGYKDYFLKQGLSEKEADLKAIDETKTYTFKNSAARVAPIFYKYFQGITKPLALWKQTGFDVVSQYMSDIADLVSKERTDMTGSDKFKMLSKLVISSLVAYEALEHAAQKIGDWGLGGYSEIAKIAHEISGGKLEEAAQNIAVYLSAFISPIAPMIRRFTKSDEKKQQKVNLYPTVETP